MTRSSFVGLIFTLPLLPFFLTPVTSHALADPSLNSPQPTTVLVRVVAQIMALLARLRDERGLTVLLVEQNVRSALSVADRGVVMSLGRVVTEAPADALRDDQDLRHAYLGF